MFAAAMTMFCIGFGTGTMTFPYIAKMLGLSPALGIIIVVYLLFSLGATSLCNSYNIVFEDVNHKSTIIRAPYRDLMEQALGQIGRVVHVVMFTACIYLICVGVLSILANTLDQMARNINDDKSVILPYWVWCLLPTLIFMWGFLIRSPKSYVWISAFSGATSILVACLNVIASFLVYNRTTSYTLVPKKNHRNDSLYTVNDFFTSVGVAAFGFAITFAVPSIQADMKDPKLAPRSSLIATSLLLVGFCMSPISAYLLVGRDLLKQSLADTFIALDLYESDAGFKILVTILQLLFISHLLSVLVPSTNPLCQEIEEILGLPISKYCER